MNENENSTVQNTEQPVTTVNESLQPAEPVAPVQPVQPVQPVEPVATVAPEAPVAPVQPIEPATPAQPIQPVQPTAAPKGKSKLPIIIIAAVLVIGIIAAVYFLFFKKVTGKQVVNGTINKVFATAEKFTEKFDEAFVVDYKKDIISSNGYFKASVETDDETVKASLGDIKSAQVKYDFALDAKNLEGTLDLTAVENDKDIIKLYTLLTDKVLYFKTDADTQVYKADLSDAFDWSQINVEKWPEFNSKATTNMLKSIKKYLLASIKDEYITLEEGTYTVDGTEIKGSKTTLTITQKRANEMAISFLESIKNDTDKNGLINIVTSYGVDKDEINKAIDDALKQLKEAKDLDDSKKILLNIYTTSKGKFLGMDFIEFDKTVLTVVSKNDVSTIKFYEGDRVELKLTYNEKSKELTWVNEAEGNKNEKIVVTFKDDGIKAEFSMTGLKVTLEITTKVTNEQYDENGKISLEFEENGKKTTASAEMNASIKKIDSINKFSTTGAKDITTLTSYEQNEILSKIKNKVGTSTIYKLIEQLTKSNSSSNQTNSMSYYCSQAYSCQPYTTGYNQCKINYYGEEYDIFCEVE